MSIASNYDDYFHVPDRKTASSLFIRPAGDSQCRFPVQLGTANFYGAPPNNNVIKSAEERMAHKMDALDHALEKRGNMLDEILEQVKRQNMIRTRSVYSDSL